MIFTIGCSQAHLKYRVNYISAVSGDKKFNLDKHRFYDEEFKANIFAYYDKFMYMGVENLNKNSNIEIVWSKCRYIDPEGETHFVVPNKTKATARPQDIPNTPVAPNMLHTNNFHNKDSVVFTRHGGWREYGFITHTFPSGKGAAVDYGKQIKDKPFFIKLVLRLGEKEKEYQLKFRVKKFALIEGQRR